MAVYNGAGGRYEIARYFLDLKFDDQPRPVGAAVKQGVPDEVCCSFDTPEEALEMFFSDEEEYFRTSWSNNCVGTPAWPSPPVYEIAEFVLRDCAENRILCISQYFQENGHPIPDSAAEEIESRRPDVYRQEMDRLKGLHGRAEV